MRWARPKICRLRLCLSSVVLSLLLSPAPAQTQALPAPLTALPPARADALSLPVGQLVAVGRDPTGGLWLGFNGADGTASLAYLEVNQGQIRSVTPLPPGRIQALQVDPTGQLWLALAAPNGAAAGQLLSFGRRTAEAVPRLSLPLPGRPTCLTLDSSGRLWVGTTNGLGRTGALQVLAPRSSQLRPVAGLPAGEVTALSFNNRRLWVGLRTGNGLGSALVSLDPERQRLIGQTLDLPLGGVSALHHDLRGRLWLVSQLAGVGLSSLVRIDPRTGRVIATVSGLPVGRVTSLTSDRSDQLWLGLSSGKQRLVRLDPARATVLDAPPDLPPGAVTALITDLSNQLWVGLDPTAFPLAATRLVRLDPTGNRLGRSLELPPGVVTNLQFDAAGRGWLTLNTPEGQDRLLQLDSRSAQLTADLALGEPVTALLSTRQGQLWVGTGDPNQGTGRLLRLDPGNGSVLGNVPELPPGAIGLLSAGKRGSIWSVVSSRVGDQLVRLDPATAARPLTVSGLPAGRVSALALGSEQELWVGVGDGRLLRVAPDGTQVDREVKDLPPAAINRLLPTPNGELWVATGPYAGGPAASLLQVDPGGAHLLARWDSPGQSLTALALDRNQQLWVATYDAARGTSSLTQLAAGTARPLARLPELTGTVTRLQRDGQGQLWAILSQLSDGVPQRGQLLQIDPERQALLLGQELPLGAATAVSVDDQGRVWIASYDFARRQGRLVRLNSPQFPAPSPQIQLEPLNWRVRLPDIAGAAAQGYVLRFDQGPWQAVGRDWPQQAFNYFQFGLSTQVHQLDLYPLYAGGFGPIVSVRFRFSAVRLGLLLGLPGVGGMAVFVGLGVGLRRRRIRRLRPAVLSR